MKSSGNLTRVCEINRLEKSKKIIPKAYQVDNVDDELIWGLEPPLCEVGFPCRELKAKAKAKAEVR